MNSLHCYVLCWKYYHSPYPRKDSSVLHSFKFQYHYPQTLQFWYGYTKLSWTKHSNRNKQIGYTIFIFVENFNDIHEDWLGDWIMDNSFLMALVYSRLQVNQEDVLTDVYTHINYTLIDGSCLCMGDYWIYNE